VPEMLAKKYDLNVIFAKVKKVKEATMKPLIPIVTIRRRFLILATLLFRKLKTNP
jgi:hypothetical protein